MGTHHGGDNDLDNKNKRSIAAISLGVSARLFSLRPLQYCMSAENYFQLLHTKMCVKGADAEGRCLRYIANTLTLRWQQHRIQNKFDFFSFGTMCCIPSKIDQQNMNFLSQSRSAKLGPNFEDQLLSKKVGNRMSHLDRSNPLRTVENRKL